MTTPPRPRPKPAARTRRVASDPAAAAYRACARKLAATARRLAAAAKREAVQRRKLLAEARRSAQLHSESVAMRSRVRRITRWLFTAQEDERLRISRELHDAVAQSLTGVNVALGALKLKAATDSHEMSDAFAATQVMVERSMQTVHHFAWELRPSVLDDLGLVAALRSYVRAFAVRTRITARFGASRRGGAVDPAAMTALFRVAQGALSNVERHSQAKHVRVALLAVRGGVRLRVHDDGRAFNARIDPGIRHMGLIVMRERMEMVGGKFAVTSAPGRGTTVTAFAPVLKAPDA